MARSCLAKVRPAFSLTLDCRMPSRWYSMGSSQVMMLMSGVWMAWMAEYSVVVLPDPVGPVARKMPCGLRMIAVQPLQVVLGEAELVQVGPRAALVQDAQDDRLAELGGQGRDAHVDGAAVHRDGDAPVLGQTPLGDVHLGHDLDARGEGGLVLARDGVHLVQRPVDAVVDDQRVAARLEVDVAGLLR